MSVTARVTPDRGIRALEHVRYRRFDDEIVLIDLAAGEYFALNALGSRMWEAAVAGRTPEEIAALIEREYEVASEDALRDCLELFERLVQSGLAATIPS